MSNPEILKEFWYDLTDDQRSVILNDCFEEYDKFLMGKEFDVEVVKRHCKIGDEKFIEYAENGNLELVKIYVQLGANINICGGYSLRYSAVNGYMGVVRYLVEHGADIHSMDDCALKWASVKGHLEIVKYLVEHGANVHAEDDYALRWAIKSNRTEVVEYLKSLS